MIIHNLRPRVFYATALSLALFFALASISFALPNHAKVIKSDPAANSTIAQAPTKITVTTAENMKPGAANSNLLVYGPDGELISQGDAKIALNAPNQMSVGIKSGSSGTYIVRWNTVSADDGDPDQGAFVFTVGSTPAKTTTPSTTTTQTPTTKTNTVGTSIWVTVVTGLVALLVGLGAGVGIGRTRKSAPVNPNPTETPMHQH